MDRMDQRNEQRVVGRIIRRLLLVASLSAALGLAFNAANPLGIRWTTPVLESDPIVPAGEDAEVVASQSVHVGAELSPGSDVGLILDEAVAVTPPPLPGPTPITWSETKALLAEGKVVMVDARPRHVFEAGHIPGAVSLPQPPPPMEMMAFLRAHHPGKRVVVYCASQSCPLSKQLAERLYFEHGYKSVQYMNGGYLEWQQSELAASPASSE